MRILVTGAAGFMGSYLVDYLVRLGHNILGLDDLSGGDIRNTNIDSRFYVCDLRNKEKTEKYIRDFKPEVVYHLAASAREGASHFDPINMAERNSLTFMNTIELAIQTGKLKRFVLFSSMAVYGHGSPPFSEDTRKEPCDIYGFCKSFMEDCLEDLAAAHDFQFTIVRPHNVYGPRQCMSDRYRNVIMIWANSLLRKEKINIFGDGSHERAYSYISDSLPCYANAGLQENCVGSVINIGGETAYSLNILAETVLTQFFDDPDMEKLKKKHVNYLPDRFREVAKAFCTIGKSQTLLGYRDTVGLQEGVKRTLEWAKKKGAQEWTNYRLPLLNNKAPKSWVF